MKGSSSQASEGNFYLYVIFMYSGGEYSHSLHRIELSDLNLSSETQRNKTKDLPKPVLKLSYKEYPGFMGFHSFDSKIYMFGGEKYNPGKQGKQVELSKDCYVFDTHNHPSYEIKKIASMKNAKFMPIVLGPLNCKFYVLSSNLASNDLEEFNPEEESWKTIGGPDLKGLEYEWHDHEVLSHAIVNDSLLFSTPKGNFTFDVVKGKWNPKSSWGGDKMFPFINEAKLLDNFWYAFSSQTQSELKAYEFFEGKGFQGNYRVRGLGGPSEFVEHETVNIMVPLYRKFCVVRSGLCKHDIHFYVTIDVCELSKTTDENDKSPQVSNQREIRYVREDYEWTPLTTTCLLFE